MRDLAVLKLKENIFFLIKFEFDYISFSQIESIVDKDSKITKEFNFESDIINALIQAWHKIIYSKEKLNLNFIINLNDIIAKHQALFTGKLRDINCYISGTNYEPAIPNKLDVNHKLKDILELEPINAAVEYITWGIKNQLFIDGNKRTSILVANKILMDSGVGLLSISEENLHTFNQLLSNYYNDENEKEKLQNFLIKDCIFNTIDNKFTK